MKKIILTTLISLSALFIGMNALAADTLTTSSGIKYVILKKGDGVLAKSGQSVKVFYSRMSKAGKVVETNAGGKSFKFQIDNKEVILGWEEVAKLMSKGEKCYCIIPSELGYGKRGVEGAVLPNETLYFMIEIVDVK